jgi:hypothetical protein
MDPNLKYKTIISGGLLLAAFAAGRYSATPPPSSVKETTKTDTTVNEATNTHTKTTVTETKKPDGTDVTVTVTDQVANNIINEKQNSNSSLQQTVSSKSKFNISVLGANDFSRGLMIPTYGLSVSKEIVGPVTVGAFGLMNGTVGISVGLDF